MCIEEVECCGAYYRTCKVIKEGFCQSCNIGYDTGIKDISETKCKMKICCIKTGYKSCMDCSVYDSYDIIQGFFVKNGYNHKKYKEALEYIRINGYEKFISITDGWKMQYGKYEYSQQLP